MVQCQQTPIKQVGSDEKTLRNLALASTSSRSSDDDAIDQRFKRKTTIFSPTVVTANNNDQTPLRIP
jgi:hypothetical protein